MPRNGFEFEGEEAFMSQGEYETGTLKVIAKNLMGRTPNQGYMGPGSDGEAEVASDFVQEKYIKPAGDESYCMDDRLEKYGVQLPGNRALSEIAGDYMVKEQSPGDETLPAPKLSRAVARKVNELVAMGRPPVFHGDEGSGKNGCAANVNLRVALDYNASNPDQAASMALDRLRLLGIDTVTRQQLLEMARIGGERAADDELWDVDAEGVVNVAIESGAPYIQFKGAHHTPGNREDMSPHVFDNGEFRGEHTDDDGHPMGALSLTYGAYVEQLRQDGFSEADIAQKSAGVILYSVAMLKLANNDQAVDIVVGYDVVD